MSTYYEKCAIPKPINRKKKKLCNGYKDKPNRYCYIHGTPYAERHEVFGASNRQTSILLGFQVDVCRQCHAELEANITGWAIEENKRLKKLYQDRYMTELEAEGLTKDEALRRWMSMIGRNYIEGCDPK